ncbi:MAG TPA: uracil phosphoribosyltransferase [Symbiobacteriaceae bacterium]|jgi:uracil phosphoribosyltransferase|nr:uracil phosphoribosyltransferase [Symbiobacteriaceae bacterium]
MSKVVVIDHPLIQHKLSIIRSEQTGSKDFRDLVREVTLLMAYEITRDLQLEDIEVKTPVAVAKCRQLAGEKIGIIPILRAGLGMVEPILELYPTAKVGHVGLYRDPQTLKPVEYYCKMPSDLPERDLIIVDPMVATGGSLVAAIDLVKRKGGKRIKVLSLIAVPEGIKAVQDAHPDVDIFTAAVDDYLNDHAYIVPGLGDAGDRLFGTK